MSRETLINNLLNEYDLGMMEKRTFIERLNVIEAKYCEYNIIRWIKFDFYNINTRPPDYGKYLICRKDGKIHWETWNTSGWAYNGNVIIYWAEIDSPLK